jgi:hypothetical protein
LHPYLGGIIRTAGGIAESIGGVADHVHLLIGLRATHRLADVLRELKAVSSGWVHKEIGMPAFAWQALAQNKDLSQAGRSPERVAASCLPWIARAWAVLRATACVSMT